MNLNEILKWRYACKKFDPEKKVDNETIEYLKESIRLTATSFGMQPFKIMVIENQEVLDKLRPVSWNQSQISDCSHLFVFCNYLEITKEMVDAYAKLRARIQEKSMEETMTYINYMWGKVREYSPQYVREWASKQCYIALGNLLTACGEKRIDSCPIEGFEKDSYDKILGLKERNLASAVCTAVGFRAQDEQNQYNNKVRKAPEGIFEAII